MWGYKAASSNSRVAIVTYYYSNGTKVATEDVADTTFNIPERVYSANMGLSNLLYAVINFGLWYDGASKNYSVKVVFE